jgi:major vault protein
LVSGPAPAAQERMSGQDVYRLKPQQYIHVLDNNSNVTRVEIGPNTYIRQDHEKVMTDVQKMIIVPPRSYCLIKNPVARTADEQLVLDSHKQVVTRQGYQEIRFSRPPFPLYPGEELTGSVMELEVVLPNSALRLKAEADFTDAAGNKRQAGDEWLFHGPATYLPRIEEKITARVKSVVVKANSGLHMRARQPFRDERLKVNRKAGEEWIFRELGDYMPNVNEEIVATIQGKILTPTVALHVRAESSFTVADPKGGKAKARAAGEEWLVTSDMCSVYIPETTETIVKTVALTSLKKNQFCVILDPIDPETRLPKLGTKKLIKGEAFFFLHPGESLEGEVRSAYVLASEEALLVRARVEFFDEESVDHRPGDRWMIYGPREYFPPVEIEVLETRKAIPLDVSEGIYIRNIADGKVRMESGKLYMLTASEELFTKDVPASIEELLASEGLSGKRLPHQVVTYRVPHKAAVQIYDYREKRARVEWGPKLVMLGPDEQFTIMSLSGGRPKQPNQQKSLHLRLGPDFMTDIIQVETSDHARLRLQLSYNWHFKTNDAAKIFQVPDFVGDACKAIASRVRGAVAGTPFEAFHMKSADIIRDSVFGSKSVMFFPSNNLVISGIDIQSVEPIDARTRESLQRSVQLAIEGTTKAQEATARHKAAQTDQEAKNLLEKLKITDAATVEGKRKELLELQTQSTTIEHTGRLSSEAKAKAAADKIEGTAAVAKASQQAESTRVTSDASLEQRVAEQDLELLHQKQNYDLEINRMDQAAAIETTTTQAMVTAIGVKTVQSIARAGLDMQQQLIKSLGIQSFLITDGKSPINLINGAAGGQLMPV